MERNFQQSSIWYNFFQGLHNRLQNEKSRLATAIQACEAASASISRPSSPLDESPDSNNKRENEAKQKLEDLIDQVSFGSLFVCLFGRLFASFNTENFRQS